MAAGSACVRLLTAFAWLQAVTLHGGDSCKVVKSWNDPEVVYYILDDINVSIRVEVTPASLWEKPNAILKKTMMCMKGEHSELASKAM